MRMSNPALAANRLVKQAMETGDVVALARATLADGEDCQYDRGHYERVIRDLMNALLTREWS